ncbi:MAG: folate-binding protein [Rhodanobacter sp.]|nr:MAG: folate-binding protein [Rhodanobacter sp.]TAL93726.1 MAG: folate-binding protein [Rhodanobacter sp.]TAM38775.1 MAG: folate-binding protein [Rhodanobacter sp.]
MKASPPAETLLLEGPDAASFAQAQFSSKVDSLAIGQWQFSAWLDAKGRVRALFHLVRLEQERYLLLLRGGSATAMVDSLRRFVFRSKLKLAALPMRALSTGAARPMHAVSQDEDSISLGCGSHGLDIVALQDPDDAWRLLQLREGWPWLPDSALDTLLPPAISLQRLQAVTVDKGCYPGQEIVARLHFRGGHKRHLHRGTLSQPIPAGEVLRIDGIEVGCVLDVVIGDDGIEALLALNDDVAARANTATEHAFDNPAAIRLYTSWPA